MSSLDCRHNFLTFAGHLPPLFIGRTGAYRREGKFGHAAHFTVRCGCVANPGDEEKGGNGGVLKVRMGGMVRGSIFKGKRGGIAECQNFRSGGVLEVRMSCMLFFWRRDVQKGKRRRLLPNFNKVNGSEGGCGRSVLQFVTRL